MSQFPENDAPGLMTLANSIQNKNEFAELHDMAEESIALYKVVHGSVGDVLEGFREPKTREAFLAGLQAFEVLGGLHMSANKQHELSLANLNDSLWDVIAKKDDGDLMMPFLEEIETAYDTMFKQTPDTLQAVQMLAGVKLGDRSPELRRYAGFGAACLRSIQLDLACIVAFRQDLDNL